VQIGSIAEARQHILEVTSVAVNKFLPEFREETGRFHSELEGPPAPGAKPEDTGWFIVNQDIIYPLALLYTTPGTDRYGDDAILNMALRGGDAIRDFQYADGRVEFLKVDGSRWGPTFMGWTNYAWLEAYAILRDHMDEKRRKRWEEGLVLAHDGEAREVSNGHVHNIPCWKAMSCYRAGALFARKDWQEVGTAMIQAVVKAQTPGGYWAEHGGPTTLYNHVYVHGIGLYHKYSGDTSVLPALEAATEFHQNFVYPGGMPVETVDGRVKFGGRMMQMGWVGFSTCPTGRRLVRHLAGQMDPVRDTRNFQGGAVASAAQHLIDGDEAPINLDRPAFCETYRDWAVVCRDGGWFGCLSAFVCPPVQSRWGQDRQAYLSLWHDDVGLILGGGNSKDQADWSSFVANGRLMPDKGALLPDGRGVALSYGNIRCTLQLQFENGTAAIEAEAEGGPALQQFTVQAKSGAVVRSAAGCEATLGEDPVYWSAADVGEWLEVKGLRIHVPQGAEFRWPSTAFNPYAADGAATFGSEVGILSARLDNASIRWELLPPSKG
jgi:hypothetical protein